MDWLGPIVLGLFLIVDVVGLVVIILAVRSW